MRIIIPSGYSDLWAAAAERLGKSAAEVPVTLIQDFESKSGVILPNTQSDIIAGIKPFCFARNVNLGWRKHKDEDYIIIMGDDVSPITIDWAQTLREIMEASPEIGLLAPGVTTPGKHQELLRSQWFWDKDFLPWNQGGIPFVCVMIRRTVWEKIGFLDERFIGYGCDDDDYNLRVRMAGWITAYTSRALVRHGTPGVPYATSFIRKNGSWKKVEKSQANMVKVFSDKWDRTFSTFVHESW